MLNYLLFQLPLALDTRKKNRASRQVVPDLRKFNKTILRSTVRNAFAYYSVHILYWTSGKCETILEKRNCGLRAVVLKTFLF